MFKLLRALIGKVHVKRMPWHLLAAALILTLVGSVFIRSTAHPVEAAKQLVFGAVGVVAFLALAFLDYRHLSAAAIPVYVLALLALAGLPLLGIKVHEARRWYDLGVVSLQPSEPMKYVLVIVLVDYFRFHRRRDRIRDLLPPLGLTLLPMVLIARQPDVGTAMLFPPVFLAVCFLAGVRFRNLLMLVTAGCALLAGAWFTPGVLKGYQKDRIRSFIDPASNPDSSAAYNARQAMMAISAGGVHGQGWGMGVLNRLGMIPERHTDFIFPVIAEEWGFKRTAPLIAVYLFMLVCLTLMARNAYESFGRLLVGGVAAIFCLQALLNMAIALRLAPITGLTLPLVSYGGSSLVSTFAGLGLASSTCLHRTPVFADEEPAG